MRPSRRPPARPPAGRRPTPGRIGLPSPTPRRASSIAEAQFSSRPTSTTSRSPTGPHRSPFSRGRSLEPHLAELGRGRGPAARGSAPCRRRPPRRQREGPDPARAAEARGSRSPSSSPPGPRAPVVLPVTYNPGHEWDRSPVANGQPGDKFALTIVPTVPAGAPERISLTFTFRHKKSGDLTIPRTNLIRPLLDANHEYTLADADKKRLAHDFVRALGEIDPTLSASDPIGEKDLTVTIQDDHGKVETLTGWVKISASLVNERD